MTRKYRLSQAVQREVILGGRVESQSDLSAVIQYGKSTNHVLHLILTLVTLGFWGWVWAGLAIIRVFTKHTVFLSVDETGRIDRDQV